MISPLSSSELCTLHGLNRAAGVLLTIFRLNRLTGEGELAGLLGLHPSTVRGHLRCLDRLGLVVRIRYHQGYGLTHGGLSLAQSVDRLLQAEPGRMADSPRLWGRGAPTPHEGAGTSPDAWTDARQAKHTGIYTLRDDGPDAGQTMPSCTDILPDARLSAGSEAGPGVRSGAGSDAGRTEAAKSTDSGSTYVRSRDFRSTDGGLTDSGPTDSRSTYSKSADYGPTDPWSTDYESTDIRPTDTGYAQSCTAPARSGLPLVPQLAVSERAPADLDQPLASGERVFPHSPSYPHSPQLAVSEHTLADLDEPLASGERAFPHPASFPHSPQLAVSERAPADLEQALAGLGLALAGLNAPLAQNGRSPARISAGERPSTTTATTTLATIFHFLWRAVVAAESLNGLSISERPAEAQPPAAQDERQDGEPVEMGQPAPAEDHPGEQGISTTAAGEALCGSPPSPHARRATPQPRRGPRPSRPSPAEVSTPASERPSLAAQANYAALRRYGVGDNHRVRQVCGLEHVTPEYIHAQAERLRSEQRLKPGLLISVVAAGDPLAEPEEDDPMRSSERARQRYAEWGQ